MAIETRKLIDRFNHTNFTSLTNGTAELDTTNIRDGRPTCRLTHTGGSYVSAALNMPANYRLMGKYLRVPIYVGPNVASVAFIFHMGSVGSDYYTRALLTASGHIVEGWQIMDVHLETCTKTGAPQNTDVLARVTVQVASAAGTGGYASIGPLESVKRRPYIVFANDDGYVTFAEDVRPLLEARQLPYTVLWTQNTITHYSAAEPMKPAGVVTLADAQSIMQSANAYGGMHVDSVSHATLAEFQEALRAQVYNAYKLGLLKGAVHATCLQNNFVDNDRWTWMRQQFATLRLGTGQSLDYSENLGGLTYIMPAAATTLGSLPIVEFSHLTTAESAAAWVTDAIAKELGIYVFGHGTNRLQPGAQYRSPLSVYKAFFAAYDSHQSEIDWLSLDGLYDRFRFSRPDPYTRLSSFTYVE